MRKRFPSILLGFVLVFAATTSSNQSVGTSTARKGAAPQPDSDAHAHIGCLAASYQDAVRRYVPEPKVEQLVPYLPQLSPENCFLDLVGMIPETTDGRAFVFSRLDAEPSGKLRTLLLTILYWQAENATQGTAPLLTEAEAKILEAHVSSDPDVDASLEALVALREFNKAGETLLLKKRTAGAAPGDDAGQKELEATRSKYYDWYSDIRMPAFAYDPPPVFSVVSPGKAIRVLAFGDFGTGSDGQVKAASAMSAYAKTHPFDFGLALGDNFYSAPDGTRVNSPFSPRWKSQFEDLYGGLGIKVYPVFGNNDYVDPDSPAAELAYTSHSKTWTFPAPYYTYTAGPAQFFAIDTMRLSSDQLAWLDRELAQSTARWKIVYGHYPIYSAGTGRDDAELIAKVLPILEKHKAQIYLCGHVHSMQDIQTDSSVHFYVSGAAGAGLASDLNETYKRSLFKAATFGFTALEFDDTHADAVFIDSDGKEVYRSHLTP